MNIKATSPVTRSLGILQTPKETGMAVPRILFSLVGISATDENFAAIKPKSSLVLTHDTTVKIARERIDAWGYDVGQNVRRDCKQRRPRRKTGAGRGIGMHWVRGVLFCDRRPCSRKPVAKVRSAATALRNSHVLQFHATFDDCLGSGGTRTFRRQNLNRRLLLAEPLKGGAHAFRTTANLLHAVDAHSNAFDVTATPRQEILRPSNDDPEIIAQ